jgi:hypothetical protein
VTLLCNSGPLMALGMVCFTVIACVLISAVGKAKWF